MIKFIFIFSLILFIIGIFVYKKFITYMEEIKAVINYNTKKDHTFLDFNNIYKHIFKKTLILYITITIMFSIILTYIIIRYIL